MIIDHAIYPDFWRHDPPRPRPCWVCGKQTPWVYLDLAYQHVDCAMYPTDDDPTGRVKIVGGERV